MKTQKEIFEIALTKRGERLVKENFKHDVWSRAAGGFYYLGRAGALRVGTTSAGSIPCSEHFRQLLRALAEEGA